MYLTTGSLGSVHLRGRMVRALLAEVRIGRGRMRARTRRGTFVEIEAMRRGLTVPDLLVAEIADGANIGTSSSDGVLGSRTGHVDLVGDHLDRIVDRHLVEESRSHRRSTHSDWSAGLRLSVTSRHAGRPWDRPINNRDHGVALDALRTLRLSTSGFACRNPWSSRPEPAACAACPNDPYVDHLVDAWPDMMRRVQASRPFANGRILRNSGGSALPPELVAGDAAVGLEDIEVLSL